MLNCLKKIIHPSVCFLLGRLAKNSIIRRFSLDNEVHNIMCVNEIDKTSSLWK